MSSFKKVAGIFTVAALLALAGTPTYAADPLVNYWAFDDGTGGTATNSAGGINGTLSGATSTGGTPLPTWDPNGVFGSCLDFTGSTTKNGSSNPSWSITYVNVPGFTWANTSNETASLWVKWSGTQPEMLNSDSRSWNIWGAVFGRNMPGVGQEAFIGINAFSAAGPNGDPTTASGLRWEPSGGGNAYNNVTTGDNSPWNFYAGSTAPGTGWNNVVFSANGYVFKLYMDGQLLRTLTAPNTTTLKTNTAALTIGGVPVTSSSYPVGPSVSSVDDVGTFNITLADGQAEAIYNTPQYGGLLASYSLAKMDKLFQVASGGLSSWTDVATGLTWTAKTGLPAGDGLAGVTGGAYYVNFGGGAGVETQVVPEPGTLALLAAGLIGLLCYAWRKRK